MINEGFTHEELMHMGWKTFNGYLKAIASRNMREQREVERQQLRQKARSMILN